MTTHLGEAKAHIERVTGYLIESDDLVLEAMDTTGMRSPQSNRRLALLGDMLLRAVIVDDWYPTGEVTSMIYFTTLGSTRQHVGIADRRLQNTAGNTRMTMSGRIQATKAASVTRRSRRPWRRSWAPSTSTLRRTLRLSESAMKAMDLMN